MGTLAERHGRVGRDGTRRFDARVSVRTRDLLLALGHELSDARQPNLDSLQPVDL